jgi:hypothetical protein
MIEDLKIRINKIKNVTPYQNKNVMNNIEELIKDKFAEMSSNDCKDFIIKSVDYCKDTFPENWENDVKLKNIANTLQCCLNNKKLTLQQFKLINRYTNIIDVFNNLSKSWD